MFVMVSGPPGAGKSTLARPIAAALPQLRSLPGPLIEVHCGCPREVAVARYSARSPTRHAGHLDADRQPDELWNEENTRPTGIAPSLVVDTTAPVDVATVVRQVTELALSSN
jgi:predicted kinase